MTPLQLRLVIASGPNEKRAYAGRGALVGGALGALYGGITADRGQGLDSAVRYGLSGAALGGAGGALYRKARSGGYAAGRRAERKALNPAQAPAEAPAPTPAVAPEPVAPTPEAAPARARKPRKTQSRVSAPEPAPEPAPAPTGIGAMVNRARRSPSDRPVRGAVTTFNPVAPVPPPERNYGNWRPTAPAATATGTGSSYGPGDHRYYRHAGTATPAPAPARSATSLSPDAAQMREDILGKMGALRYKLASHGSLEQIREHARKTAMAYYGIALGRGAR